MASPGKRAISAASLVILALGAPGCTRKEPEAPVGASDKGEPELGRSVSFEFDSLDARPVTSAALRGKVSVLVFVTTWDLLSQAQVGYVVQMAKHDGDQVNYVLVALQDRADRELVEEYGRTLKVTFPVALGDPASRVGQGPLGDVHMIPTVVIVDSEGRLRWKHVGLAKNDVLRGALSRIKKGD